jgi:hypothetical protein
MNATDEQRFKIPSLGRGQIEYLWSTDCVVDVVCHLDYEAGEEAQHYGDAPYPGCPEEITLCAAYVRGVDILPLLSDKQIEQIEEAALCKRCEA